jgi:hypothetical protein
VIGIHQHRTSEILGCTARNRWVQESTWMEWRPATLL